ncbi:4'-phosphopantetheinyl transferase superfamily protein [Pseudooceanicola sp. CBS1P-1]|uniref:4'-phosphopantetheinyl transferase superfamily protein n=1 Tax=Pseudooceanicola albus TaxID=2692189 RepID=A0A6L7GAG3_9RHOB|nr:MULTISPECIES: 4'-phosphopantetheinyl transferase superfamily protein [Pseudooceanicola]MBT9386250.1 4'-phosphopantetheinyl transferase superfamily protein [Pseudooceanicola endophyticus]MXN20300.1 4'-phosphopantetheinyl transferase superfamily protein [Pseudooceanicola albus]
MTGAATPPVDVEIWGAEAPERPCALSDRPGLLSAEEEARAAALSGRAAQCFRRTRGLLRHALARRLAELLPADFPPGFPPGRIPFATGPHGRPELAGPARRSGLHFNLSHSGDRGVIALCTGAEPGIDLEQLRPRAGARAVLRRLMAPQEAAHLLPQDGPAFEEGFHRLWVCKEAVIKATGEGLSRSLASFVVDPDLPRLLHAPPGHWHLAWLPAPRGYRCALALRREHPFAPAGIRIRFPSATKVQAIETKDLLNGTECCV